MSKQTSFVSRLRPLNLEEERRKFFFDAQYNPQFEYEDKHTEDDMERFGAVSAQYVRASKRILDTVIEKWGTLSAFSQANNGELLTANEVKQRIRQHLSELGLQNEIMVRMSTKFVSRTSMHENTLNIRLPMEYREHSLTAMLYHEVDTHYLRTWNERQQPWYKHHGAEHFQPYQETEEGLATIHGALPKQTRYLFSAALSYYASYLASRMSFAELNAQLKPYMDSREKRWSVCLKAKRGQTDTSLPGGNSKSQIYLRGAVQVLKWLKRGGNPRQLYVGKIALIDLNEALKKSVVVAPRVPLFLENEAAYRTLIDEIIETNKLL